MEKMGALFRISILFICFGYIHSKQSCAVDSHCDDYPNEICSSADLKCYSIFNSTDYASVNVYNTRYPDRSDVIAPVTIDPTDLFDNDDTTSISLLANKWLRFDFILNGKFWVHDIELRGKTFDYVQDWFIDGIEMTISDPITASYGDIIKLSNPGFPMSINNVSFRIFQEISGVIGFNIAGAYASPRPSAAPTQAPTDDSNAPTVAPSVAPSYSPSAAPTAYPTPDVCEEYVVNQPCCGHFGFETEDDQVNIRDSVLTTCQRYVETDCCATTLPMRLTGSNWGCKDNYFNRSNTDLDAVYCAASYFDTSVNTTDDIVGVVLNGTNTLFVENTGECKCNWTINECAGEDVATCGTTDSWDMLWDMECWGNETWPQDEDFTNETCWKDTLVSMPYMEHLLWEPCSEESFIGSVTEVQSVPSEMIHDGACTCSYAIRDCRVLEDQSKTQCDYTVDCADEGECSQELAAPCCGYESYEEPVYEGVLPAELDEFGYPVEPWTCKNDTKELCPDIFDGSRLFTATSRVDWWYDLDADAIEERCGCLYVTDECHLPTSSPTADPTQTPSAAPTKPDSSEDDAHRMVISFCFVLVVSHLLFM